MNNKTAIPCCLFVWVVCQYPRKRVMVGVRVRVRLRVRVKQKFIKHTPCKHLEYCRGSFRSAEFLLFLVVKAKKVAKIEKQTKVA